jgi:hypothetical protein
MSSKFLFGEEEDGVARARVAIFHLLLMLFNFSTVPPVFSTCGRGLRQDEGDRLIRRYFMCICTFEDKFKERRGSADEIEKVDVLNAKSLCFLFSSNRKSNYMILFIKASDTYLMCTI